MSLDRVNFSNNQNTNKCSEKNLRKKINAAGRASNQLM